MAAVDFIPYRCMGNRRNEAQCQSCARLPRTPEEEEGNCRWIDPDDMYIPCDRYKPLAIGAAK